MSKKKHCPRCDMPYATGGPYGRHVAACGGGARRGARSGAAVYGKGRTARRYDEITGAGYGEIVARDVIPSGPRRGQVVIERVSADGDTREFGPFPPAEAARIKV